MQVIKAPEKNEWDYSKFYIFLAGSIEMGTAENWQERVEREFAGYDNVVILNPRRDDWDSSWVQSIENEQFNEQVNWELRGLDYANHVIVYFAPDTKSPITLLELGIVSVVAYIQDRPHTVSVCCPEGFWRKGNVDIVCNRFNIPTFNTIDELIQSVKNEADEFEDNLYRI